MTGKNFSVFFILSVLLTSPCHYAVATESGVADFYSRNSSESLVQIYEDPARAEWQKPRDVVERLEVKPGDVVADIGSGTGYFTVLFADKAGKNGHVFAVDIDKNMVNYVERRSKKEGLTNVTSILARSDDPLLAMNSVDLIFICNTYMFLKDRNLYLAKLKDILRKQGRLALVSYNRVESPEGPPIHTRLSRDKTVKEVLQAGFVLDTEYFFLPYQHFLVFKKL